MVARMIATLLISALLFELALLPVSSQQGWQEGFAFYEEPPAYGSPGAAESLRRLRTTGAEVVVPVVTWYVPDASGSQIVPGPLTPTDEELAMAVSEARRQGFQVVLLMHVNSLDGTWRAFIDPADKPAWFGAYRSLLIRYAEFARQHDVQGMVLGSELVQLTRPEYTEQWRALIREVRQRFPGFLTYSAQWGADGPESRSEPLEEYTRIGFWSDLDYLGIAAYFNLAPSVEVRPSRDELRRSWEEWRQREIGPFQASQGKPVLFTEVGYRSTPGAAARPWDESLVNGVDQQLQADLYAALFESWRDVPWFRGVYWWYWSTNPDAGGGLDPGYSPQNKPAEAVVREWFGRLVRAAEPTAAAQKADLPVPLHSQPSMGAPGL